LPVQAVAVVPCDPYDEPEPLCSSQQYHYTGPGRRPNVESDSRSSAAALDPWSACGLEDSLILGDGCGLELLPELYLSDAVLERHSRLGRSSCDSSSYSTASEQCAFGSSTSHVFAGLLLRRKSVAAWFSHLVVLHPLSSRRLAWDTISLSVLAIDLVVLPIEVFDVDLIVFFARMRWISALFWTLDIAVSFVTGIYIESIPELRLSRIARSYVKSWFILDIIIIVPEWCMIVVANRIDSEVLSSPITLKATRIIRLVRLLRLVKLERLLHKMQGEIIKSFSLTLYLGIFNIFFMLVIAVHIIACLWFSIGQSPTGWVTVWNLNDERTPTQYLTAAHWALTQFHGTSDIYPRNQEELAFALCVLLVALITFSYVLGRLTDSMMRLHALWRDRNIAEWTALEYFMECNISVELAMRARKYLKWQRSETKRLQREQTVLNELPSQLIQELHYETRSPTLMRHQLFFAMSDLFPAVIRGLCSETIEVAASPPSESIFSMGALASHMYFVSSGTLTYLFDHKKRRSLLSAYRPTFDQAYSRDSAQLTELEVTRGSGEKVEFGQWLSEAALWTRWEHRGQLTTLTGASLLAISACAFAKLLQRCITAHAFAVIHAKKFLADLRLLNGSGSASDLPLPTVPVRRRDWRHLKGECSSPRCSA